MSPRVPVRVHQHCCLTLKEIVLARVEYGWKSLAIDLKSTSILQTLAECLEHGKIYSMHLGGCKDEQDTALPSRNINYSNRHCFE